MCGQDRPICDHTERAATLVIDTAAHPVGLTVRTDPPEPDRGHLSKDRLASLTEKYTGSILIEQEWPPPYGYSLGHAGSSGLSPEDPWANS